MKISHLVLLLSLMPPVSAQEASEPPRLEVPAAAAEQQVHAIQLQFMDATETDRLLRQLKLVGEKTLLCEPDARTNRLILRGSPQHISEVTLVLKKIDVASPQSQPLSPDSENETPDDTPSLSFQLNMSVGERKAAAELLNLKLRQEKLRQQLGAGHPELKMIEKQIEFLEAHSKTIRQVTEFYKHQEPTNAAKPISIEETVLKLRPDLNVKIEGVAGVVQVRGKREDVDTFSQLVESIRILVSNSSVEQLQDEYEETEQQVEAIADRIREIDNDDELREQQQTELRRLVRRMFSLRMTIQQSQLDEAQADLNASRARLDRRQLLAERIIARRVADLISDDVSVSPKGAAESVSKTSEPENLLDYKCRPNDILRVVVPGFRGTADSPATLVIDDKGYLRLPNGTNNPAFHTTVANLEEQIYRAFGMKLRKDQAGSVIVDVLKAADLHGDSISKASSLVERALSEVQTELKDLSAQLQKLSKETVQVFNGEEIIRVAAEESARLEIELATIESQMSQLKLLEESKDGKAVADALKEIQEVSKPGRNDGFGPSAEEFAIQTKVDDARKRIEVQISTIAGRKYRDFTCLEDARRDFSQQIEGLKSRCKAINRKAAIARSEMSVYGTQKEERRKLELKIANQQRLEGTLIEHLQMLNAKRESP